MILKVEHILRNIDILLNKVSGKDLNYLLMLIPGLLGFLSYYYLFDLAANYENSVTRDSNNMGSQIRNDQNFLQRNSESMILTLKNEVVALETKVDEVGTASQYLDYKLSQIDYLFYDQEVWGTFINKISQNAQKNHIQIMNFTNKLADSNATFGHLLDLSISTNSSFKNSLKFINYLESNNLVVDIHSLSIDVKDRKIVTDMNLSIWGINR